MTAIGGSQDDGDVRYAFPKRKSQPGSAQRNSIAIRDELAPLLEHWTDSDDGRPFHLLELASGQGEQIAALASRLALSSKQFNFHPTEADEASCREVDQRCEGLTVVVGCKKLDIDVESDWQSLRISLQGVLGAPFDAVLVCNVVHIVPWATVETLFRHINPDAGLVRRNGGRVIVYGAFNEHGRYTSNGNQNFDRYLKEKDGSFGLRDVQKEIEPLANRHGMHLDQRIEMPAGNLMLIFRHCPIWQ